MRITGGELGGRIVKVPKSDAIRPTEDRVRAALFNMLQGGVAGCRFLDLFAGSGAVGLEAVSRGAAEVVFVESSRRHLAVLKENIAALAPAAAATVVAGDVYAYLERYAGAAFDYVYADPPYALGEERGYAAVLAAAAARGLVRSGGLFIAEMSARQSPESVPGWELVRERAYGRTRLVMWRRCAARAFIFDMDGTIIDNIPYHIRAWKEFSRRYGHELSEAEIIAWMGRTNRDYQERILGRPPTPEESARMSEEKESVYRELYRPHLALAPGLAGLFAAADRAGIAMAVASGAPRPNVDFVMDGLDLRRHFGALVDDRSYRRGKPDPECFLVAAAKLGVEPAACTVFEDAVLGIRAGKAAGMYVVAVDFLSDRETLLAAGADRVVSSFAQCMDMV